GDIPSVSCSNDVCDVSPASGAGACEAALANTLTPVDRAVFFETGHFATLWHAMASRLGLRAEIVPGDWRRGADPERLAEILAADPGHEIKAVCAVHNETSTGAVSRKNGRATGRERGESRGGGGEGRRESQTGMRSL